MKKNSTLTKIHFNYFLVICCFFFSFKPSFCSTQSILLNKGFQLVPNIFESVNLNTQNFGNSVIVIWSFDPINDKYQFFTNDVFSKSQLLDQSFTEFQSLEKHKSYYFFSDQQTKLSISATTIATPIQFIQFTKTQETQYLTSSQGFLVNDLGTAYHSIWVMRNKTWSMYSPDQQIINQYATVANFSQVLSNEPFVIISKNASRVNFPTYSFPKHYGLQTGLKVTAEESYGYTFSTSSTRVQITDPLAISQAQDSFILWLNSKHIQNLLIDPITNFNNHYLTSSELSPLGVSPPRDNTSLCLFINKLKAKNISTGLDVSQLALLNQDNYQSFSNSSHLSSKLSTSSYVSILKSFETTGCLVNYFYSSFLPSSLKTELQTQISINLFSLENEENPVELIQNLNTSTAYSSISSYPVVILTGNNLTQSSKEALVYSRHKTNCIFLYSTSSTLNLSNNLNIFDEFDFARVQALHSKYTPQKYSKVVNIVLLGKPTLSDSQNRNLSNVNKTFSGLGYKVVLTDQNYITADLYYIIHYSDIQNGDLSSLLNINKPKFWQENSIPLSLTTSIHDHYQFTKTQFDEISSDTTLNYQSNPFSMTSTGAKSLQIKSQDMSPTTSTLIQSLNEDLYLFAKDNLYYINTDLIGSQFIYPLRALLNISGITNVSSHHYSMTDSPIVFAQSNQNISISLDSSLKNLETFQSFNSSELSNLTSYNLDLKHNSLYFFSKNHSPTTTIFSTYTYNGSEIATIASTSVDLDLDPLSFQWTQHSGNTLTINDAQSQTLRVQLPQRTQAIQTFTFSLQSFDGKSYSAPVTTHITIPANDAPIINVNTIHTVAGSTAISIEPTITDPNSNPLTYTWSQVSGPTVSIANNKSKTLSFTSPNKIASTQTLVFKIVASDSWITTSKEIEVRVSANKSPNVFVTSDIQSSLAGFPFTFLSSSSDGDGDSLTYTWRLISPNDLSITVHNGFEQSQLSITTPTISETTDIIVGLKAYDGISFSSEKTITLRVEICNLDICN